MLDCGDVERRRLHHLGPGRARRAQLDVDRVVLGLQRPHLGSERLGFGGPAAAGGQVEQPRGLAAQSGADLALPRDQLRVGSPAEIAGAFREQIDEATRTRPFADRQRPEVVPSGGVGAVLPHQHVDVEQRDMVLIGEIGGAQLPTRDPSSDLFDGPQRLGHVALGRRQVAGVARSASEEVEGAGRAAPVADLAEARQRAAPVLERLGVALQRGFGGGKIAIAIASPRLSPVP